MTFIKTTLLAAALAFGGAQATLAASVDIIGGETSVDVTADLAGLGLTPGLTGTATAQDGLFVFGITGGSVDTDSGDALIEHDGSGVSLTAGTTTATVGNFLIDTAAGNVTGALNGTGSGVEFFTFGTIGTEGIQLLISDTLAGALTDVFGAPDLAGEEFGIANTSPVLQDVTPVPLPAGLPLLAVGLVAFGVMRRRQQKLS